MATLVVSALAQCRARGRVSSYRALPAPPLHDSPPTAAVLWFLRPLGITRLASVLDEGMAMLCRQSSESPAAAVQSVNAPSALPSLSTASPPLSSSSSSVSAACSSSAATTSDGTPSPSQSCYVFVLRRPQQPTKAISSSPFTFFFLLPLLLLLLFLPPSLAPRPSSFAAALRRSSPSPQPMRRTGGVTWRRPRGSTRCVTRSADRHNYPIHGQYDPLNGRIRRPVHRTILSG